MSLSIYIRDLLYRYECVIIPEFGGFLTKTISAQIDEKSNTLYPPSKRLGFNAQLVENDGLLANYIASVDKVPYETALNYIDFEVKEWQQKLINEDIILDDIGVFSLNEEGNLQFKPNTNTNFLTEAFGLTPIVAPEVSREDLMEEDVVFDSISDIISEDEIFINNEYQRSGLALGSFFKYAAIFAVLFAVGYFLVQLILKNNANLKVVEQQEAEHNAMVNKRIQEATFEINKTLPAITLKLSDQSIANESTIEVSELGDQSDIDSNENLDKETTISTTEQAAKSEIVNQDQVEDVVPIKEPVISKKPEVTTVDDATSYKYHIIAGAFKEVNNAYKKVTQLKAKGYQANVVGVNKWQLHQVAFGSFNNKEEAQEFLRQIKKTEAKDAWMLVK